MSKKTDKKEETSELLTTADVAKLLRSTPRAVSAARARGLGPRAAKIRGLGIRYRRVDVERYIDEAFAAASKGAA